MVDPREFSLASTEDISEVDIVDSGLCTSRINPESILNRGIQVAGGLQNQQNELRTIGICAAPVEGNRGSGEDPGTNHPMNLLILRNTRGITRRVSWDYRDK